MKSFFILLICIAVCFSSCCRLVAKCDMSYSARQRFYLKDLSGNDLLFGASHRYDPRLVRFYSLDGGDTLWYGSLIEQNIYKTGDSFLTVQFQTFNKDTVLVRLNDQDTDTLTVAYEQSYDRCCGTYSSVHAVTYNDSLVQTELGVATLIK